MCCKNCCPYWRGNVLRYTKSNGYGNKEISRSKLFDLRKGILELLFAEAVNKEIDVNRLQELRKMLDSMYQDIIELNYDYEVMKRCAKREAIYEDE